MDSQLDNAFSVAGCSLSQLYYKSSIVSLESLEFLGTFQRILFLSSVVMHSPCHILEVVDNVIRAHAYCGRGPLFKSCPFLCTVCVHSVCAHIHPAINWYLSKARGSLFPKRRKKERRHMRLLLRTGLLPATAKNSLIILFSLVIPC